ncbi:MAG: hypothetical protein JXQ97_15365 [Natronospirillum sp.]
MSTRNALFDAMKARGLFWSYRKDADLVSVGEDNFIEECLRYGDWPDWVQLFSLYDRARLFQIWQERIKNDLRFKKQNLLLARVLFGLDIEAEFFTGGRYDRDKKLRLLAS